jgi:hypothetical protein
MGKEKAVNHGIDTLVVNLYHTDQAGEKIKRELDNTLRVQLEEWKHAAQEVGEPVTTSHVFNGLTLLMQPNGALHGQFPWMLKSRDMTLYVSTGSWNGIGAVRFNSEFLWSSQGVLQAIIQVQEFVDAFFADEMYLQASAVDLCVDIVGWSVEELDKKRDFVSRSFKRRGHAESDWGSDGSSSEYSYGLKETGLDFSHGGPLSLTIYDKSREMKKSGKEWFEDLWRAHGWSEEDGRVWRVELKYKREVLHELYQEVAGQKMFHGIEDVYVLIDRLPLLWAYGVGSVDGVADALQGWIRCVVPGNDKKRTRWPTHPAWKVVQAAFSAPGEKPAQFGKVVRKRWRDRNVDRMLEAIVGYASSLAVYLGKEYGDELTDLSMVLHWIAQAGPEYLERVERDFAEEVQRKRVRFGVPEE